MYIIQVIIAMSLRIGVSRQVNVHQHLLLRVYTALPLTLVVVLCLQLPSVLLL